MDATKVRAYLLSAEHPRGRHKARVFRSALGLAASDAPILIAWLRRTAGTADAVSIGDDRFGGRYRIDAEMVTPAGRAVVRSLWLLPVERDSLPRLITAYVVR